MLFKRCLSNVPTVYPHPVEGLGKTYLRELVVINQENGQLAGQAQPERVVERSPGLIIRVSDVLEIDLQLAKKESISSCQVSSCSKLATDERTGRPHLDPYSQGRSSAARAWSLWTYWRQEEHEQAFLG